MSVSITDFNQFTELRAAADRKDPAALREVAGQFEALFLQMMLKNMRAASFGDPLMGDNKSHELYRDMMDQQLSLDMASGKGIGLAETIIRQLGGQAGDNSGAKAAVSDLPVKSFPPVKPAGAATSKLTVGEATIGEVRAGAVKVSEPAPVARQEWSDPESFAKSVWPYAKRAARMLNVSPAGVLAQAALETGWGAKVMQRADGNSSFNLFGIKAANGWQGDSVQKRTLEFDNGVARQETAKFRAYNDVSKTFDDYAEFLGNNPRYETVRNTGENVAAFASALSESGYATDPKYAQKIKDIANGPTMRRVLETLGGLGEAGR